MSEIMQHIKAYDGSGRKDFDALKAYLVDRDYPAPERYDSSVVREQSNDMDFYTEGTWDEVRRARNIGLLTNDEYIALCKADDDRNSGKMAKDALPWHDDLAHDAFSEADHPRDKDGKFSTANGGEFKGEEWLKGKGDTERSTEDVFANTSSLYPNEYDDDDEPEVTKVLISSLAPTQESIYRNGVSDYLHGKGKHSKAEFPEVVLVRGVNYIRDGHHRAAAAIIEAKRKGVNYINVLRIGHEKIGSDAAFSEADHPRGQPENAGEFAKTSGGAGGRESHVDAEKDSSGHHVAQGGKPLPAFLSKVRIPPAWTHVTYATDPKADVLVTGKDAKGRGQAIYSESFKGRQAAAKFARIKELEQKIAGIQKENAALRKSKDAKVRDCADLTMLIMDMGIRPGSESDTGADKHAYGATTLEARHVIELKGGVRLRFTGKKGVDLDLPVRNEEVVRMLLARKAAAGGKGKAKLFNVSEKDLLDHVHAFDGGGFKTKDFRTLLGTAEAARIVAQMEMPKGPKEYRKAVMSVAKAVSTRLGNTPTIALQSYINPVVFAHWNKGESA